MIVCSFLQDFFKEKGSRLQLICDAHTVFLLCGEKSSCCKELLVLSVLNIKTSWWDAAPGLRMQRLTCPLGLFWKCLAGGLKLAYFLFGCPWQLFFYSKFPVNSESFWALSMSQIFFSSISGIKMTWRIIKIHYPLHGDINNLNCFSAQLCDFNFFQKEP